MLVADSSNVSRGQLLDVATAVLLALLIGCDDQRAFSTKDPWHAPTPRAINPPVWEWTELERSFFMPVQKEQVIAAKTLLVASSWKQINSGDAKTFAGEEFQSTSERKPYLVRGVYLNEHTGSFSVSASEGRIIVHHGCLGNSALPMKRWPIIVLLMDDPSEVFVECSMAE